MSKFTFSPAAYGVVTEALLSAPRLPELGPGRPDPLVRDRLASLTVEDLFGDQQIADRQMAACCLSGLWLWFDYLDESHSISQSIPSSSGSYWHGIMHRREPDYSNSKYWFRRVGQHPVFDPLAAASNSTVPHSEATWDPFDFVDQCQRAIGTNSDEETNCRSVQRIEWQLLFDYCFRQAVA